LLPGGRIGYLAVFGSQGETDMMHLLSAGLVLAVAGSAMAQTYSFTVDAARSGMDYAIHNGVCITGTLIGDFDAQDNPGGTKTRNGYFGGNDNEPVDYVTDATVDGEGGTEPGGAFTLTLLPEEGALTITGLSLDLLNGAEPSLPLTVAFGFDTFRTYNPDSLYIGGILPPIEIGEAQLTTLTAIQSGPGAGILTPVGDGRFTFEAAVEAEVTLVMSVLAQPVEPTPLAAPLALVGTITLNEDGTATVTIAVDQEFLQEIPLEDVGFEDVPLDLPTILPPGFTAHLLMDGTVELVTIDMAFGILVIADGQSVCRADFNGDGLLDLFDFLAFQNAFVAQDPSGDFNGDGLFDLFDFLAFGNAFVAGC
jgi:hypothetical protein